MAEEHGKGNKLGIEKYFSTATIALVSIGTLIFVVLFPLRGMLLGLLNIPDNYIALANVLLPCMIALSVIAFLVKITDGTLRGVGRLALANYYNLAGRVISIISILVLLKLGYGIWGLFWGYVIFHIFIGFLAFLTIYARLGKLFFSVGLFDLKCLKKIARFGGTMTASQLIAMLLGPLNKVVIARYVSLSGVTYYDIGNIAVVHFRSIFEMGIRGIMPEVSRLSVYENARKATDKVLKKSMALVLYLGVPSFITLFLLGPNLLRLWLSSRYVPEIAIVFRIILVGYLVNLLSVPIYYLFMGVGKVRYCFINQLVQSVLNGVLISIFIILGIISLYFVAGIYSFSIAISSIILIILFASYRRIGLKKIYQRLNSKTPSKPNSSISGF